MFLFALALLIRSVIAQAQIIAPDGVLYIKIAKDISAGYFANVTEYGFFNLYSFLIAVFQKIFENWEFSAKAVSVLFGSLSVIPLFFLAKTFFNVRVALLSTLFYAVHPRFVELSSDTLREPTCWFFAVTALWLAWEGLSRNRYAFFAISALSAGFAMVTRLEGAIAFAVIILWILLGLFSNKNNKRKILLYLCIFLFSLPVLMSPFLLVIKNKLNRWELGHPLEKITGLIITDEEEKQPEAAISKNLSIQHNGLVEIAERHRYALFSMEVLWKFLKALNIVLLVFFLFGIWRRKLIGYSAKDIMIAIWLIAAFLSLFLYVMKVHYVSSRHALFMVLPALIWAGIGFFEIRERLRKWFENKKSFPCNVRYDTLLLILAVLVMLVPQTVSSYRHDKKELKKAGIELKEADFSTNIFIVQPTLNRVAFYADMQAVQLPFNGDEQELRSLFEQHKNGILLIDDRTIDSYAPSLRKIVNMNKFEKIQFPAADQFKQYSISLYRIR